MSIDIEQSSKGRSFVILIVGAVVLSAGLFGLKPSWSIVQIIRTELHQANTPYDYPSLIFAGLCFIVALTIIIAGLSLIISALKRKQYDLIPGPTLYFLGVALAVIGGFLLMGGFTWQAALAVSVGIFLIYWEWGYHVS